MSFVHLLPEALCRVKIPHAGRLLRDAAAGGEEPRAEFVKRYEPVVRAYLAARWRGSWLLQELDDAAQEIFIECLRGGGLLDRARADRPGGFRAFLYGAGGMSRCGSSATSHDRPSASRPAASISKQSRVVRIRSHASSTAPGPRLLSARRPSVSRRWPRKAARRPSGASSSSGSGSTKGMPIREIARLWGMDAAVLHHEYARARQEFLAALRDVIASHHPGSPEVVDWRVRNFLSLLE